MAIKVTGVTVIDDNRDADLQNVTADSVQLNGGTGDQGTLTWNVDEETLDLVQNGATLQLGQEVQVHCRNNSGVVIPNGAVVMVTGTLGSSGRITIATYDNTTDVKYVIGIATEVIDNDSDGKVTSFGKVRGLDTSAYTEGTVLYTAASGGLTATEPTSGVKKPIAFVITSHATNGVLMVRVNSVDEMKVEHGETAYGWGDHSVEGYLTATAESYNNTDWDTAYGWGDHAGLYMDINAVTLPDQTGHNGQFLQTDGTNADWATVDTSQGDTAYGWGDHSLVGYYSSGSDVSLGNITATGYLRGPATFTIDPAAHGDDTGTVVIAGNLQVDGTTTTINSTTVTIDDKTLVLGGNTTSDSEANGTAVIFGAHTNPASIYYTSTTDRIGVANANGIEASNFYGDVTGNVTGSVIGSASNNVLKTGDTMTGNLSFGDNDKVTFGAGSDLQIYHTGSHSYIDEGGTGNLYISSNGAGTIITGGGGTQARFFTGGQVDLWHNNSLKLATTSTGINVTGTATMDGLTVDGAGTVNKVDTGTYSATTPSADFVISRKNTSNVNNQTAGIRFDVTGWSGTTTGGAAIQAIQADGNLSSADLTVLTRNNGTYAERMRIDSSGNVGIGTTTPVRQLVVNDPLGNNAQMQFQTSTTGNEDSNGFRVGYNGTGGQLWNFEDNYVRIATNNQERFRVSNTGNVGIGVGNADAATRLHMVDGNNSFKWGGGQNSISEVVLRDSGDVFLQGWGEDFRVGTGTYDSTKLIVKANGSVGIATTTNSGYRLSVYEPTNNTNGAEGIPSSVVNIACRTDNVGEGPTIDFNSRWGGGYEATSPTASAGWTVARVGGIYDNEVGNGGALVFYTHEGTNASGSAGNPQVSEKVRIKPTGSVGVGTPNPTAKLDVEGDIRAGNPFFLNSTTIDNSYTIPSGNNAMTAGPIEIASSATITIPDGSTWTIL